MLLVSPVSVMLAGELAVVPFTFRTPVAPCVITFP